MRDFIAEKEDAMDDLKELVDGALKVVERLRNPREPDSAFNVYVGCGALSVMLASIEILIQSRVGFLLHWAWALFWMAVGSFLMLQGAMPICRMRTAYRASCDFARCREIRQRGGCARWQFFKK